MSQMLWRQTALELPEDLQQKRRIHLLCAGFITAHSDVSAAHSFSPLQTKASTTTFFLAAQRYTYGSKPFGTPWGHSHSHNLLAVHNRSVCSVQTFWQHSCLPRAWLPTSSNTPIRPHPLRQRDDTETLHIAEGDAFEKHFKKQKKKTPLDNRGFNCYLSANNVKAICA